ncbi:MAG: hypothetical protein IJS39_12135, partial [Synergistaceae bacterium]|nr:hypothetical protein [Synergistaceae bacterium]
MAKTVDDILIPLPKPRRRRRPPKSRSGKGFMKFLLGLGLLMVILGVIFSVADIGGNVILGYAQQYLSENLGLTLSADSITGNPVKGYTLNNFELADDKGRKILSAGFLSGSVNFKALFTGKIRLAEISLGGMSMDIDTLIAAVQNLKLPNSPAKPSESAHILTASPAYAESENTVPDIPLDRFSLKDSRFSSAYGVLTVNEIGADLQAFDIDIDAKINDLPVTGTIDMGESAGITGINRSNIALGAGKIFATGGLTGDKLDFHAALENLDLQELTGLYPQMLRAEDFSGTANINLDITGKTDSPRISGTTDYKGTKIYGFPVERISSNINYADYRVGFSNIQASAFSVPVQGEIAASFRPNEKLSVLVKLDGSEANLEKLDEILGIPELKALSGKVAKFSANISGHVDELNGLVSFTAPRIAYAGRALTNIRAQMKLAQSDKAIVDGKFAFEGAQGYIQGSVASFLTRPNLDVTAKIVDLDVKRVENMIPDASDYKLAGKITASVNIKGSAGNPKVTGSLNSPEFSGFGQTITKPAVIFAFSEKTLTLSKTEGSLNGMPINVNGTISPLPSSNPNLNISATISMTPAALKAYVPDIDQYKLNGKVNAGIKVQGSVNAPSVKLVASSPNLQAMDMITAKDIEMTTALNGDLTKLDRISLNAAARSLTASGVTFTGLNAKIDKNGDKITLGGLNAKSGAGTITGAGTADISGKTPLDFGFKFTNLALGALAGSGIKGNLSGSLKISGANTNPDMALDANVPSLSAQGFTFRNILADISGNMQNLQINKLRGELDGSEISASGNVQIIPALKLNAAVKSPKISLYGITITDINIPLSFFGNAFASTGGTAKFYGGTIKNNLTLYTDTMKLMDNFTLNGADLGGLVRAVSADMKDKISGTADLFVSLSGTGGKVSAKGTLTIPALKAYGFSLSDVNLPVSYSGNSIASAGGTAKLYSGTLKNTLAFNLDKMTFTDNIDASGIDVNALIQAASGGLEGRITGKGRLTMRVNGSVKDKVAYSGSGNFSLGAGGISGFKWLDMLTRIHNTKAINYASVNAPLSLQTGKLILKAGTIANAPKNDPMYQYAKLTQNGTINFGGKDVTLDLLTESSINYQLINAIQGGSAGGLQALFKGGVSNWQDGLKAFLSGGLAGAEKAASTGDFRIVNLKISGKAASPSFSGLKIGPSTLKPQTQTQAQSADKKQDTQNFKEKIIDRAIDALAPGLRKQETTTTTPKIAPAQNQTQPNTQQSQ